MSRVLALAAGLVCVVLAGCQAAEMGGPAASATRLGERNADAGQMAAGEQVTDGGAMADVGFDGPVSAGGSTSSGGVGLVLSGALDIAQFRAAVEAGQVPDATAFSMAGWLNECGSPLPAADPARPIDVHALAALVAEPGAAPDVLLQLGLNSAKNAEELSAPVALVVAVDRSGSMTAKGLAAVAQGVALLADRLPPASQLAVLSFGDDVQTVWPLQAWTVAQRPALEQALAAVVSGGGTNLYAGLQQAVDVAAGAKGGATLRRQVVLVSDGGATVGEKSSALLLDLPKGRAVAVSVVAVGAEAPLLVLGKLAQQYGGTLAQAPATELVVPAFETHGASLLQAAASALSVQFELAQGWKVLDDHGLPLTQSGQVYQLGQPAKEAPGAGSGGSGSSGAADAGASQDATAGSAEVPGAPPTLNVYLADKSGLLAVRLQPPAADVVGPALDLSLVTVKWSYSLAVDGLDYAHQTSVQVKGLLAIPDGGYELYTDPVARRTAALVRIGDALQAACQLHHDKAPPALAQAPLQAAVDFAIRMQQAAGEPLASDPVMQNAKALATKLLALVGSPG